MWLIHCTYRGRRGRERMVVGFTAIYRTVYVIQPHVETLRIELRKLNVNEMERKVDCNV
jgi:hypothetical protein